jgi:hypothetical protein
MTNQVPFIPAAAARLIGEDALDGDNKLTHRDDRLDDELDEGETTDSEATVEEDVREGDDVNDNIEK